MAFINYFEKLYCVEKLKNNLNNKIINHKTVNSLHYKRKIKYIT